MEQPSQAMKQQSQPTDVITLQTAQFGTLQIRPHHIFHFPQGIIGFEHLTRFVLISDEKTQPIKWLLSVDDPTIGFPVVNVLLVRPDYPLVRKLNSRKSVILTILTLGKDKNITANLRAPIILDIEQQEGKQIVLTSDEFSFEYVVLQQ